MTDLVVLPDDYTNWFVSAATGFTCAVLLQSGLESNLCNRLLHF